jgi:chromosome condensin MukBEF ATPase and DNA-binding subunit MukB
LNLQLRTKIWADVQVYENFFAPMPIVMQMSMLIPQPTDNLHQRLKALNMSAQGVAVVHKKNIARGFNRGSGAKQQKPGAQHVLMTDPKSRPRNEHHAIMKHKTQA